ncbi:hypothetical protein SUGI_0250630 [Cryptomeria japonica]|nr:hypothetical protein SUGI_0250630 [Cryptomeria japonica]
MRVDTNRRFRHRLRLTVGYRHGRRFNKPTTDKSCCCGSDNTTVVADLLGKAPVNNNVGSQIRLSISWTRVPAGILPATATRGSAAAVRTSAASATDRVFGRMSGCSVLLLSAG